MILANLRWKIRLILKFSPLSQIGSKFVYISVSKGFLLLLRKKSHLWYFEGLHFAVIWTTRRVHPPFRFFFVALGLPPNSQRSRACFGMQAVA